jgi:acyl-CoA thioester hydrolase
MLLSSYLANSLVKMIDAVTVERIRVRYGETDQMGHAYYANYLYWFEQARGMWCRERGFTYKQFEAKGVMLPVVEVNVKYRGEVHYDDWVAVKVWVSEIKRSSMRFDYEITNESTGKVTTLGYSWHVFMGAERRAITIPAEIRDMLERDPAECTILL